MAGQKKKKKLTITNFKQYLTSEEAIKGQHSFVPLLVSSLYMDE